MIAPEILPVREMNCKTNVRRTSEVRRTCNTFCSLTADIRCQLALNKTLVSFIVNEQVRFSKN